MHRHFWKHHEHRSRHGWAGHMRDHLRARHGRQSEGRVGRLLDHGDLRYVILSLVADKPRHGYDVMRELEERTGGTYRPSPGVIYPTFSLLEDEGFVRNVGDAGGRKAYEITNAGKEALEANRVMVDAIFARLDEAGAQSSGARPKLQRAIANFHMALGLRLKRGEVSEEQIDAIAAMIDETALKIERV